MTQLIERIANRLREAREEAGLTQQQVADWLGVRRPGVAEIEAGKRAVKSEELARLASLYGRSVSWLSGSEPAPSDRLSAALFRTTAAEADPVLRREVQLLGRRCALLHDAERGLTQGRANSLPAYVDDQALEDYSHAVNHGRAIAYQERQRLGLGLVAPLSDAWGIVEGAGLRVFPLQLGAQHPVDGIYAVVDDQRSCVGVNVDKWFFRQIFTVVHEYAHALMDRAVGSDVCNTADGWKSAHRSLYSNRELRANQFAAVFLVPREALAHYVQGIGKLRVDRSGPTAENLMALDVVRAQDYFGVSADMLLWRLVNERLITMADRHRLLADMQARGGVTALARSLGYDWRLRAQPVLRAHEVALLAYGKGLLSLGELSEIFGLEKSEMLEKLAGWGIAQEFANDDALVGAAG